MRYPYRCTSCGTCWEVIKSVREIDSAELCRNCNTPGSRYIAPGAQFYGASDWDKAEFNPGLGCVVRNGIHRKQLIKERGLEEVGNECPQKLEKHYERERERKREERYDRVIERGWDA